MQKQTTTRLHLLLAWLVESAVGYDSAGAGASLAGPRQIDAKVAYKIASLRVDQ
jgi:hypothetical protein